MYKISVYFTLSVYLIISSYSIYSDVHPMLTWHLDNLRCDNENHSVIILLPYNNSGVITWIIDFWLYRSSFAVLYY